MQILSVLFDQRSVGQEAPVRDPPQCFRDLNLDQIVASVTAGREEYALGPFFYTHLRDVEAIRYRHAVFRDLEERATLTHIQTFAVAMRAVRDQMAKSQNVRHGYQKQRWFLDAVITYCRGVVRLHEGLGHASLASEGLQDFRQYLATYIGSEAFVARHTNAMKVQEALLAIHYDLLVDGGRIEVKRHEPEPDYGEEIRGVFQKFEQGAVEEYAFKFYDREELNHIEEAILDRVAHLYQKQFQGLAHFCTQHRDFEDAVIGRFDREVQFFLAYLEYLETFKQSALSFCYPDLAEQTRDEWAEGVFDLALAEKLTRARGRVVTNDFELSAPERIIVVTGANQGGKTTFARAFGQLHYLASLGCPVPARRASLALFDELFTHFEREEAVQSLTGKLEDELLRIHDILSRATAESILIMNETFGATTLSDALVLGRAVLNQVIDRGMRCVCVTFIEELASLDAATVSMVSTVDPSDPAIRTFRIIRQAADGRAHALAIAQKYRLSYQDVRERVAR